MICIERKNHEYQIEFISGSGYNFTDNERGSVLANIICTKFDENNQNVLYQREYTKRLYFDKNKNVYKTKKTKDIWFNFA